MELPLFQISEIIGAGSGISMSTDLIEACCERGIRLTFLTPAGQPFAMLSSPLLTATVQTRREQMAASGDRRGLEVAKAIVRGKLGSQAALLKYFGKYLKGVDPAAFERFDGAVRAIAVGRREVEQVAGERAKLETREGLLTDESRRAVAGAVLERLEGEVGFRGRRHRLKSVIQIQARNVAAFLRGGEPYRPFPFKW